MNFSPLTQSLRPGETTSLTAQSTSLKKVHESFIKFTRILAICFCASIAALMVIFTMTPRGNEGAGSTFIAVAIVAAITGGIGLGVWWQQKAWFERCARLCKFALANNLDIDFNEQNPRRAGLIFSAGGERVIQEKLRTKNGMFEIGTYRYVVGSGKNRRYITWGYMHIPLKRHVPHMVLDATANNAKLFKFRLSNLPVTFKKDQTLALEGDFNNYFTLYAPKEYERDALYVFTPDFMALLVDNTATFDVETVDNSLFVYGPKFDLLKPEVWQRLLKIADTVGAKAVDRTDYYADKRVGDRAIDAVAAPGRRLKSGVSVVVWIIVAFIVLQFINMFWDILSVFFD